MGSHPQTPFHQIVPGYHQEIGSTMVADQHMVCLIDRRIDRRHPLDSVMLVHPSIRPSIRQRYDAGSSVSSIKKRSLPPSIHHDDPVARYAIIPGFSSDHIFKDPSIGCPQSTLHRRAGAPCLSTTLAATRSTTRMSGNCASISGHCASYDHEVKTRKLRVELS